MLIKKWDRILTLVQIVGFSLIFFSIMIYPEILSKILNKTTSFSFETKFLLYFIETTLLFSGLFLILLKKKYLMYCSENEKRIIIKAIYSIIILILIVLLLELNIRIFIPQKTLSNSISESPAVFEVGKYASWRFKPNTKGIMANGEFKVFYSINSLGMRDKEHNVTKRRGITRILTIGDSFTEGFGVEQNESYPIILDSLVNKEYNVEVFNAGIGGYSPDTEYIYLKELITIVKPDIVLLGFYVGNDIQDITKNAWVVDDNKMPVNITSEIMMVKDNKLFLKDKGIYTHTTKLKIYLKHYINLILLRWSHTYIWIQNKRFGSAYPDLEGVSSLIEVQTEDIKSAWEKTKMLIKAMHNISQENNASFQIIIIPSRLQVNPKEWSFVEKNFQNYKPKNDLVQEELVKLCHEEKINCIDVLPEFKKNNQTLYRTLTDIHLTKKGHSFLAEIISERIRLNKTK